MKKIFLDDLPKWEKGTNKNKINWFKSIGYKVKGIYEGLDFEVKIVDYDNKNLWIKYLNKKPQKISTTSFKDGKIGRIINKFKIEIGTRFKDDKRDITIIDRKYISRNTKTGISQEKYYKYHCNKCGFECGKHYKNGEYKEEHWITENNLNTNGCACCCPNPQVVVPKINSIVITAPEIIKFFINPEDAKKYTKTSHQKIQVKCPDCNRVKNKFISISDIYNKHSIGCNCGDGISYPEKIMFNILEQLLNNNFEYQFSPKWCKYIINKKEKRGRYDFYFELDDKKYIIETDGGWHKIDNNLSGQTKEESKEIDDYKDKQAKLHNIEIIRVNCNESNLEYIKDNENGILNSKLAEIFDLNKIDWIKVEGKSLNNKVKQSCEIKRDNLDMTCTDIGKIMNLNYQTIINYLKKGSKLGWCSYDAKEEARKNGIKNGKENSKKVEMFKDNFSLGIFESATELERKSEELFGVKLNRGCILKVCRGERKYYNKFYFSFV